MRRGVGFALLLALAAPGLAGERGYSLFNPVPADQMRPFCSDSPGFGIPTCIVDAGHVMLEVTPITATFERANGINNDNYAIGQTLARVGLNNSLEVVAGWTPINVTNISGGGSSIHETTTGDLGIGLKQSLRNPDGGGFSVAMQPFIDIPTDGGRVGFALALPFAWALSDVWSLGFTPEIGALPDALQSGYHVGGSAAVSLSRVVGSFNLGAELFLEANRDPEGTVHAATANFSLAWQPAGNANLNFNLGADFGLDAAAADAEIYCGFARRF